MGCPSLRKLPVEPLSCNNHFGCDFPVCALRNAMAMKKWMLEQQHNKNMNEMTESFHFMYI